MVQYQEQENTFSVIRFQVKNVDHHLQLDDGHVGKSSRNRSIQVNADNVCRGFWQREHSALCYVEVWGPCNTAYEALRTTYLGQLICLCPPTFHDEISLESLDFRPKNECV